MFSPDTKFYIASVIRSKTNVYKEVFDRKYSSFYFKLSGSVNYTINGKMFTINTNDFAFIPAHSHYIVESVMEGEYISLHFDCPEFEDIPPRLYTLSSHIDVSSIFRDIWRLWTSERDENIFACYSLVYRLFSFVLTYDNSEYSPKSDYDIIADSVNHLEDHLFDKALQITSLGNFSNISYVYFERIFKKIFKTTPMNYVKSKRINYAKKIFSAGEFSSIAQVGEAAGYEDPLYFSRLFKKETGMSPTEYIKSMGGEVGGGK